MPGGDAWPCFALLVEWPGSREGEKREGLLYKKDMLLAIGLGQDCNKLCSRDREKT